ncbi:TPA: hypothetical protein NIE38_001371 [Pseudomonas aeruginosa]|nr:hypothetical protein [Pseudomonas aeruginosa]HCK4606884.1 hypothetical protein [Pseudomonas aeruginosa]
MNQLPIEETTVQVQFLLTVYRPEPNENAAEVRKALAKAGIAAAVERVDFDALLSAAQAAAASLRWHREQGHFAGMDGVYLENLEAAIKGAEGGAP